MDALLRMVGSVTALGAALIALAVGAAPVVSLGMPWLAVPLLAAGLAQGAAAVLGLRGRRFPPLAVLAAFGLPTAVWIGTLWLMPTATAGLPFGPMLAETGLALVATALLGRRARRVQEPGPLASLLSLTASAAVVAAVATTALAGTQAGEFAVPHGEHGIALDEHGHH